MILQPRCGSERSEEQHQQRHCEGLEAGGPLQIKGQKPEPRPGETAGGAWDMEEDVQQAGAKGQEPYSANRQRGPQGTKALNGSCPRAQLTCSASHLNRLHIIQGV